MKRSYRAPVIARRGPSRLASPRSSTAASRRRMACQSSAPRSSSRHIFHPSTIGCDRSSPPSSRATTAGSSRSSRGAASACAAQRGRLRSRAFWLASARRRRRAHPLVRLQLRLLSATGSTSRAGPTPPKPSSSAPAAPGWPPHPGWHNPWVSLLFYLKVSELDSIAARLGQCWGNIVLALAALGTVARLARRKNPRRAAASSPGSLLLWLPVPFYAYSVAYGSVPIFFPAGGPTPGTTRATASSFCPRSRSASASPLSSVVGIAPRAHQPASRSRPARIAFAVLLCARRFNCVRAPA